MTFEKQNFQTYQKPTVGDYDAPNAHARKTFDQVLADFGGFPGPRYSGFAAQSNEITTVTVSPGRLYRPEASGMVGYIADFDAGTTLDLLAHLPVPGVYRIATIVAYGNPIDTVVEPRTFVKNVETKATESRDVSTKHVRQALVQFVLGAANPTPVAPATASDQVAVANVLLSAEGVVSVTQLTENRVQSNYMNQLEIALLKARLAAAGSQIDTLRSDIAGAAQKISTLAPLAIVRAIASDVSRLKDTARLPDDYAYYAADTFMFLDDSDTAYPGYSARVRDGLRFPAAGNGSVVVPLALLNPTDPSLMTNGNMSIPAYTSDLRLEVKGKDTDYPLTNAVSTTKTLRKVTESRQVQTLLGTETMVRQTSPSGGVTWIDANLPGDAGGTGSAKTTAKRSSDVPSNYKPTQTINYSDGGSSVVYKVPHYSTSTVYPERTEWVENTVNVNGSMAAATYLNSQEGFLTGVDLYFTKKAATGNVRVLITDTDITGRPMLDRVHEERVIDPADIKIYPEATTVDLKPSHQRKGARFAVVLISSSPHFVAQVAGNKMAAGSMFYMVDGQWQAASGDIDMAMGLRFAKFFRTRVVVGLQSLSLAGGIDSISINADVAMPEGTDIVYEIMVNNVWRSLLEGGQENMLASKPELLQFRATLIGTVDLMPALGTTLSRSEVTLIRPATTFTHISKKRTLPAPVTQVEVTVSLENWDAVNHSHGCTLLTGPTSATIETPDATSSAVQSDGSVIKTYTFNIVSASQIRVAQTGSLGVSTKTFHVSERLDIEF